MNSLQTRYDQDIQELCDALASGRVPWDEPVALQGPPMLGRSGMALRGMAALLAWQAGGKLPEMPLAWRLLKANDNVKTPPQAVLKLTANSGEALYGAVPDSRPRRLVDGPDRWWSPEWSLLRRHLEELTNSQREMRSISPEDQEAICSLAVALLRTYLRSHRAQGVTLTGPWTPERVGIVAAWAQLLADSYGYSIKAKSYWKIRRARPSKSFWNFRKAPNADQRNRWLDHLCRSGLMAGSLPAELRELEEGAEELTPPEMPVRAAIFRSYNLRRAPGVGTLAAQIPFRELTSRSRTAILGSTLSAAEWRRYAIRGLLLAEHFGSQPLPGEPGQAWREVGRALRADLKQGGTFKWLELLADDVQGLAGSSWRGLARRHRAQSWLHPTPRARLEHLRHRGRFHVEDLNRLLGVDEQHVGLRDGRTPVSAIPSAALAAIRRPRRTALREEHDALGSIAAALGAEPSWASILDRADACVWGRQARPKRTGGTRWLDVPPPALRQAQTDIAALLLDVFPRHAWLTAFHAGGGPATHARAHAGARAAVHADIHDFFGSLHPWHLEPWLGLTQEGERNILPDWSEEARRALLRLMFHQRGGLPYLPQGAPSSPVAANLAGLWLDHAVIRACVERFGEGSFTYTRYADDLVLSTNQEPPEAGFGDAALEILGTAVRGQGLALKAEKSWIWLRGPGSPLVLGGLRVPDEKGGPIRLDRDLQRRARAALHRLRHRLDYMCDPEGRAIRAPRVGHETLSAVHGLMAYAYVATGDPRWLAYSSGRVARLARLLAGPLFSECLLAGWSDEPRVEFRESTG